METEIRFTFLKTAYRKTKKVNDFYMRYPVKNYCYTI